MSTPEPSKTGRPPVLDDAKRREIYALSSIGFRPHIAARFVGCSLRTIQREFQRNEEFRQRLCKSRIAAQVEPLNAVRNASKTSWRAGAWYLERVNPRDFARRVRPPMMHIDDVKEMTRQMIYELARAFPDRATRRRIRRQIYRMFEGHIRRSAKKYQRRAKRPRREDGSPESKMTKDWQRFDREFAAEEERRKADGGFEQAASADQQVSGVGSQEETQNADGSTQ